MYSILGNSIIARLDQMSVDLAYFLHGEVRTRLPMHNYNLVIALNGRYDRRITLSSIHFK